MRKTLLWPRVWLATAVAVLAAGTTASTTYAQAGTSGFSAAARDWGHLPSQRLPIGPEDLDEHRSAPWLLAAGVTLTTIIRGRFAADGTTVLPDPTRFFTISLNLPIETPTANARNFAFVASCENANTVKQQVLAAPAVIQALVDDGQRADDIRVEPWVERRMDGFPGGLQGCTMRLGHYTDEVPATNRVRVALAAAGFRPFSDETYRDMLFEPSSGRLTVQGPFEVHVASVNFRRFDGCVSATLGDFVDQQERVTDVASKEKSVFAMNGGYFAINTARAPNGSTIPVDNYLGIPAGLSVIRGVVNTAATDGRAALILGDCGRHARVDNLTSEYRVRFVNGAGQPTLSWTPVDGLNRFPDRVRDCGRPDGLPTVLPVHDFTCTQTQSLVVLTPNRSDPGGRPLKITGREAVVDPDGIVIEVRDQICDATCAANGERGSALQPGQSLVQALGASAGQRLPASLIGTRMQLDLQIVDSRHRRVPIDAKTSIINGGPQLVRNGEIVLNPFVDGLDHTDPARNLGPGGQGPSFFANFNRPAGRTLVGITADGRLLLIQIDGKRPLNHSVGVPLLEAAHTCKALGAVTCINIDGGGSSESAVPDPNDPTRTIQNLVGVPSDGGIGGGPGTERAVADVLTVVPRR